MGSEPMVLELEPIDLLYEEENMPSFALDLPAVPMIVLSIIQVCIMSQ